MTERFHLDRDPDLHARVAHAYEGHRAALLALLPPEVEVHHVGSTAVSGALTKGDLDILVRVRPDQFAACEATLAAHYARNVGSHRSATLASFAPPTAPGAVDLGIQLVARGGPEDFFLAWRDRLRGDPALLARYDALKRACDGLPMETYRARKSALIEAALAEGAPAEGAPAEGAPDDAAR